MNNLEFLRAMMPLLAILGALLLGGVLLRAVAGSSGPPAPIAKPFMTPREAAMRDVLEQLLPMYRLHAQVAMGALLKVPQLRGRRTTPADRNAFSQKIVDFVVEDPTTGKVVAVIEVDDRSHIPEKDRARDAMMAKAGYRTLRIPGSARPSVPALLTVVGPLREQAAGAASPGSRP